ncbi:MAG: glycerol-3-phosphate acyltransferase [Desulfobacteraceae bacterium]|nr:glycerol-3-phosphate acyltransferase [Desulfobacteraceae bacterium]
MVFALGMLCAYLAGSVNFSILLFRLLGKGDPRSQFSGNPGVTNVFRQAGWTVAGLVLLLDVGRAAGVALAASHFLRVHLVPWAGFGLILGNHFPCFHKFKGGKGVANYLGFCAILLPMGTVLGVVTYLTVFAIFRIPFIASFGMLAVLAGFGLGHWWPDIPGIAAVIATTAAIVWFHRGNIASLSQRKQLPKV